MSASSTQDSAASAAAWNNLVNSLAQIKSSQPVAAALALTASAGSGNGQGNASGAAKGDNAAGLAASFGLGGQSLLNQVLAELGVGKAATGNDSGTTLSANSSGTTVTANASGTTTDDKTISGILADAVALAQSALTLDPDKLLQSANTLVNSLLKFVI